TPRRVTQLSQYGGNLTIVLEVQFHGFHAFFTRVHGHPPFWSRILSAHPTSLLWAGRTSSGPAQSGRPAPPVSSSKTAGGRPPNARPTAGSAAAAPCCAAWR